MPLPSQLIERIDDKRQRHELGILLDDLMRRNDDPSRQGFRLVAPIVLTNPAIVSGVALFSHGAQPYSVSVPAGQSLSLFDLSIANTQATLGASLFYGIKLQVNTDAIDTGAGIAIFNTGKSDNLYICVAGKGGAGPYTDNLPTGIGIDLNKQVSGTAENSTSSGQQGIQIWDRSTTNQGVGGPRGIFLNKYANLNTDHLLMTLRGNRNALQLIVKSNDAGYSAAQPLVRIDDEYDGSNWWSIRSSGEQVFAKNGIGIQWTTPGGKTAYILAATNDLKLKSGGTGIRFVNQADTQTIVMMQDDLSVDIPNNETRFQALKIVDDRLENYATNATGNVSINYRGYAGGTTQFRNLHVFDGKGNVLASFLGESGYISLAVPVGVGVTPTARLHLAAGTTAANTAPLKLTTQAAGLTTVEQGAFELIGNSLQFTQLAKRRGVMMGQSVRTSSTTVQNTVTESAALATAEHGAGYLEVGKMEEIVLFGTLEQRSNPTAVLTFNIKYAGVTVHTVATTANNLIAAGSPFILRIITTCRSTGATGTMQINSWLEVPNEIAKGGNTLATIDTTTAQNTTVTAQWGEANAANILVVQQARVQCTETNK